MDYIIIGYILTLGFIVIPFHFDHYLNQNVPRWWIYPVSHLVLAFLIIELLRFATKYPSGILTFLRTFYPVALLTFGWSELNNLVTILFSYWANSLVINLDKAIFAVHPTVWIEQLFTPWLTELMNFVYVTYFLYIPICGFSLYFRGMKKETLDFLFLVFLTYTTSFILFILFPAEGAWIILKHLHTIQHEGGFFMRLVQFIQQQGSVRGGALPSSHVSAAFTIVWATIRYQRRLGLILLPFAFAMALSTVYLRYHHAVDALGGIIWGTTMYWVGIVVLKRWYKSKMRNVQECEMEKCR